MSPRLITCLEYIIKWGFSHMGFEFTTRLWTRYGGLGKVTLIQARIPATCVALFEAEICSFSAKSWIQTIYPRQSKRRRYLTAFSHTKLGLQKCAFRVPLFPMAPPSVAGTPCPEVQMLLYAFGHRGFSIALLSVSFLPAHMTKSSTKFIGINCN